MSECDTQHQQKETHDLMLSVLMPCVDILSGIMLSVGVPFVMYSFSNLIAFCERYPINAHCLIGYWKGIMIGH
jgi:hypothetical protein